MSEKSRKRLAILFAMLGSANIHERERAREKLDELLRKNRKSWNDLTELLQNGSSDSAWNIDDEQEKTTEEPAGLSASWK
jgi:hypothetical protein